jgi:hypothetical protein
MNSKIIMSLDLAGNSLGILLNPPHSFIFKSKCTTAHHILDSLTNHSQALVI